MVSVYRFFKARKKTGWLLLATYLLLHQRSQNHLRCSDFLRPQSNKRNDVIMGAGMSQWITTFGPCQAFEQLLLETPVNAVIAMYARQLRIDITYYFRINYNL